MMITPNAFQLTCPPIPHVRIALIGLGHRGMKTLLRYAFIEGATITHLVDVTDAPLEEANRALAQSGRPKATTMMGADAWRKACEANDVDLIYICTEWATHTEMATYAMEHGKHVAVEVPAATNVEECWKLVRTAERTQRHCFMTENCCFDFFALQTKELYEKGLLGTITHCEGAYIHQLHNHATTANWMEHSCCAHGGNPYPTHGIGPIAHLLGIHRSDRLKYLVSMTADGNNENHKQSGGINSTLIKTEKGVSILLQLDVTTPRPYNRLQVVCGTKGYVQKYPMPVVQIGNKEALSNEAALNFMQRFSTSRNAQCWTEGHAKQVPNEMNYAMDCHLIHCLREGLPLDIDVYDAAEWSCIAELSKRSADAGGMPIAFPDFRLAE